MSTSSFLLMGWRMEDCERLRREYQIAIGVLGIQDSCHFTSRDIGYFPFNFQGYGILCSIFGLLSGILIILEN